MTAARPTTTTLDPVDAGAKRFFRFPYLSNQERFANYAEVKTRGPIF